MMKLGNISVLIFNFILKYPSLVPYIQFLIVVGIMAMLV